MSLGKYETYDDPVVQSQSTQNVFPDVSGITKSFSRIGVRPNLDGVTDKKKKAKLLAEAFFNYGDLTSGDSNKLMHIKINDPLWTVSSYLSYNSSNKKKDHIQNNTIVRSSFNGWDMPSEIRAGLETLIQGGVPDIVIREFIRSCITFIGVAKGEWTFFSDGSSGSTTNKIANIFTGTILMRTPAHSMHVGMKIRMMPPIPSQFKSPGWFNTKDGRNVYGKLLLYPEPITPGLIKERLRGMVSTYVNNKITVQKAVLQMSGNHPGVIPHVALPISILNLILASICQSVSMAKFNNLIVSISEDFSSNSGNNVGYMIDTHSKNTTDPDDFRKGGYNTAVLLSIAFGLQVRTNEHGNVTYPVDGDIVQKIGKSNWNKFVEYATELKDYVGVSILGSSFKNQDSYVFGYYENHQSRHPFKKLTNGILEIDQSNAGTYYKVVDSAFSHFIDSLMNYMYMANGQDDGVVTRSGAIGNWCEVMLRKSKN